MLAALWQLWMQSAERGSAERSFSLQSIVEASGRDERLCAAGLCRLCDAQLVSDAEHARAYEITIVGFGRLAEIEDVSRTPGIPPG